MNGLTSHKCYMLIHTTNTHCIRSTIRLTLNVGAWSMTYEATITRQRL